MEAGFQIISRLRGDADLQYVFTGEQKKSKGRNRKFDGKVDFQNLNPKYVKLVSELENEKIYSLKAYSRSMKATVNTVVVYTKGSKDKWVQKIYFSTV